MPDTIESAFKSIDEAQKIEFEAKSYLLTTELFPWFAVPGFLCVLLAGLVAGLADPAGPSGSGPRAVRRRTLRPIMIFFWPHLLWLLAPIVAPGGGGRRPARQRRSRRAHWPKILRAWAGARQAAVGNGRHNTRGRLLLWLGLAFGVVALARPQWGRIEEPVFDQSREIVIALDLSRSMLAPDVRPSRLERARLLIQGLLDGLRGERVGLVVFAGTAFLQVPLSADYEVLNEFLPSLNPAFMPVGGTNYEAMLHAVLDAFSASSTADRYLIVLSDGESQDDGWQGPASATCARRTSA